MTKNLQIIFLLCFLVMAGFSLGQEVQAAACANVPLKGTTTISASCTFSGTVNGVEQGNLVIEEAATLTINGGRTVVWNPTFAVYIQGKLFIDKGDGGGQLRKTLIWYIDADNDNYPDSLTMYAANSADAAELLAGAPAGSAKRRSNQEFVDNYGNNLDLMAYGWIDQDIDTYPARAKASPGLVLNINWTGYVSSIANPNSQDCDDTNANIWRNVTVGRDHDRNGYVASGYSSVVHCLGDVSSTNGGRNYFSISSVNYVQWDQRIGTDDCYDTNANVYPGQTSYFTTHRGDGLYDYNCDSEEEKNFYQCFNREYCTLSNPFSCYSNNSCNQGATCYANYEAPSYYLSCGDSLSGQPYVLGLRLVRYNWYDEPYDCRTIDQLGGTAYSCETRSRDCNCR